MSSEQQQGIIPADRQSKHSISLSQRPKSVESTSTKSKLLVILFPTDDDDGGSFEVYRLPSLGFPYPLFLISSPRPLPSPHCCCSLID